MRKIIYNEHEVWLDEGVLFGRGVFETILWTDRAVFLDEHLERLKKAMNIINLEPLEENVLKEYLNKLNIENKAVKITVTGLNIIITEKEISYKEEDYNRGMKLIISKVKRNSTSRLCYIKSTCYIENLIEKENAKKKGFDDVIFLNEKDNITETSSANIFIVKKEKIFTPKIEDGLLGGIVRAKIIEKFQVIEKSITLEDLKAADEIILTNSLMGAIYVREVSGTSYTENKFSKRFKKRYTH